MKLAKYLLRGLELWLLERKVQKIQRRAYDNVRVLEIRLANQGMDDAAITEYLKTFGLLRYRQYTGDFGN